MLPGRPDQPLMGVFYDTKPLSDFSDVGYAASRIVPCTAVQAGPSGSVSFTFIEIVNEPKDRNRWLYDKSSVDTFRHMRQWDAIWQWNDDPPTFVIQMNIDYGGHHDWVTLDGYGGPLIPGDTFSVKVDGLPQGVFVRILLRKNPNYGYESGGNASGQQSQYFALGGGAGLPIKPTDIVREVRLTTSND